MIDSRASNIVITFEVMKELGLKVDTPQGSCCAMKKREVIVIGMINAMPHKLLGYHEKEQTMSVLVIDIPPQYAMLFSRKWSSEMGNSTM